MGTNLCATIKTKTDKFDSQGKLVRHEYLYKKKDIYKNCTYETLRKLVWLGVHVVV